MKHLAYIYYAYRRTLSYPVVRVYFIILVLIAVLILLFVRIDITDNRITGFSILGESANIAMMTDLLLKHIAGFIYYVLLFALIAGISGIFPDMMKKGSIEINLTIGYSRAYVIIGHVIGTIACIAVLTFIPAILVLGSVLIKTGAVYWGIIGYFMFFALSFGILFCWIAFISIITNNAAAASIITLGYVFFLEYFLEKGEILPNVKIGGIEQLVAILYTILPQISNILDLGLYLAFGTAQVEATPLIYSLLSSVIVLIIAIAYFRKIDF